MPDMTQSLKLRVLTDKGEPKGLKWLRTVAVRTIDVDKVDDDLPDDAGHVADADDVIANVDVIREVAQYDIGDVICNDLVSPSCEVKHPLTHLPLDW